MSAGALEAYAKAFRRLRTARGASYPASALHRAPHKPLLLLAVLDLAERGDLTANFVALTPQLGELFQGYWRLIMPGDRNGQWAYPFFYLRSEGFWHLVAAPGQESALSATREINSMARLREIAIGASLDADLYSLICSDGERAALRAILIEHYFAQDKHIALLARAQTNLKAYAYGRTLLRSVKESQPTLYSVQPYVRSAGFRLAVVTAYEHRCVLCGVRLVTDEGRTAATAAHIVPWSVPHNDDPRNGLCLCRLCHWVFDEGLAAITLTYRVQLSVQCRMVGNIPGALTTLDARPIFEPSDTAYNPDPEALKWHLQNRFLQ